MMSPWRRPATLDDLFGIDLRSLALFRVGLAAIVLVDLGLRCQDFVAHYCASGWLPLEALRHVDLPRWPFAPHLWSDQPSWVAAVFAVQALLALMLLVGWRTRVAAVGTWFLAVSLQMRNPAVLDGADLLLRLLLFWGMFLPLGAFASLDARRRPALRGPPARIRSLATAALLLQPVMLYEFAAMTKVQPEWLYEGTGVYYALHLDQLVLPLGKALREHMGLLWVLNYWTLALEYLGPLLLFWPLRHHSRVRLGVVLLFVALQAGFGVTIRLMLFPWVSTVALVPFLPTALWDGAARRCEALALGPRAEGAPETPPPALRTPPWASRCAGVLVVYCLLWNVQTLPDPPFRFPAWLRAPGLALRLDQQWYLFAPPWRSDGWYVVTGVLPGGREIDLRTGEPARWGEPPGDTYARFDTHRTWAHMRFLRARENRPLRAYYLRRLAAARPEPLLAMRLYYVMEVTGEDGSAAVPEQGLLWEEVRLRGVRVLEP